MLTTGDVTRKITVMHVCQAGDHFLVGEEGHVLDAKGFEDVLVHIVIQGHVGRAFEHNSSPVQIYLSKGQISLQSPGFSRVSYTIVPLRAGFKEQWHLEITN